MLCYCGSRNAYETCCKPYIEGEKKAETAEVLMRSRYSAYAQGNGHYLHVTQLPSKRHAEDIDLIEEFAQSSHWLKLEVIAATQASVEFKAYYRQNDTVMVHHELSRFVCEAGTWFYDEGTLYECRIGRNESCPCGSGKKFKKCCAR